MSEQVSEKLVQLQSGGQVEVYLKSGYFDLTKTDKSLLDELVDAINIYEKAVGDDPDGDPVEGPVQAAPSPPPAATKKKRAARAPATKGLGGAAATAAGSSKQKRKPDNDQSNEEILDLLEASYPMKLTTADIVKQLGTDRTPQSVGVTLRHFKEAGKVVQETTAIGIYWKAVKIKAA